MAKNWLWARGLIRSARDKGRGKPLRKDGSTYLVVSRVSPLGEDWDSDEAVYACEYWGTEVVRYYPNGVVAASLGGWGTVTTKRRIDEFSPLLIGSDRGQITACAGNWHGGQRWLGTESTWFFWKDDKLIFQDGGRVPDLCYAFRKDQVPKKRDTLASPKKGDAFEDEEGMWVLTLDISVYPRRLKLLPYFGDHPDDRSLVVTDKSREPRELPSTLELLAGAHTEGTLRPLNRFIWANPGQSKKGE